MIPFFIVGAPRSGTTMLRDLLKQSEELHSPEETHFYRWAAPFGGAEYFSHYKNNEVLKRHREMDGIGNDAFFEIAKESRSRFELTSRYSEAVCEIKGKKYWFEKTPQNVYQLPLLARQFYKSNILHIYRHPYSVVKSLLVGKVLHVADLLGAINYWLESVQIIEVCRPFLGERLYEIKYEDLVICDVEALRQVERSSGVRLDLVDKSKMKLKNVEYASELSRSEMDLINELCGEFMDFYGYDQL